MIISGLIKHFGFLMFSGRSQGDIWKKWITLWNEIKYCLGFVNSKVIYVNIYWYQVSACNIINKETLAQVLSCEFCEIFKNTFFTEHLRTTAPDDINRRFSYLVEFDLTLFLVLILVLFFNFATCQVPVMKVRWKFQVISLLWNLQFALFFLSWRTNKIYQIFRL